MPSSPCPARQVLQGTLSREWAALGPWLHPQKSILILSSWPLNMALAKKPSLGVALLLSLSPAKAVCKSLVPNFQSRL